MQSLRANNFQRNIVVHASCGKQPDKGILYVLRGKGVAVGKFHILPELEGISKAVVGYGVILAQGFHDFCGAVRLHLDFKQTVKNVLGDKVIVGGFRHVHSRHIAQRSDAQRFAAARGFLWFRAGG